MRIPRTLACTRLLAVLPLALLLLAGCADHELPTAPLPPATPSFAAIQVGCNTADLISAIAAANTNPGSDLIELEAGCTYTFTAGIASAVGPNALPRITSEITIIGNGATIQRSSDEQTPEFRILAVAASASLELSDLTIKGGRSTANGGGLHIRGLAATENVTFSGNSAVGLGGAIASADGTVTIRNSTFVDNVSGTSGGAIANWPNTALEVERTTFFRNGAGEDGGAMWNGGTLQITDATFGRNSAVGLGGAISSVEGVATITNSTFSNNSTAVRGGAIANYPGATLNITGGSFSDNSSATSGGGIRNGGTLSILQSTFAGNRADADGGAISTSGPTTIISKTTFAGNHTDALGGGISNTSGIATITNSTFSGNSTAARGGGIANYPGATLVLTHSTLIGNTAVTVGAGIRNGGTLTLRNNLIAGNNASSEVDLSSAGTTAAYNLIGSPGGHAIADGVDHNIVGVAGADLNLGALAANGGLTWTHALLAGSPAIDAGTCTDHNGDPVTTDQRGVIRPQPAGGACDIGAFEAPPACEGVQISLLLADGSDPVTAGATETWTATVEVTACQNMANVSAQGGSVAWAETQGSTDDGQIEVRTQNRKNSVLLWSIGSMQAGEVARATLEVTGTVAKKSACGSQVQLTGEWSATAAADPSAGPIKYDKADPLRVLIGC